MWTRAGWKSACLLLRGETKGVGSRIHLVVRNSLRVWGVYIRRAVFVRGDALPTRCAWEHGKVS